MATIELLAQVGDEKSESLQDDIMVIMDFTINGPATAVLLHQRMDGIDSVCRVISVVLMAGVSTELVHVRDHCGQREAHYCGKPYT